MKILEKGFAFVLLAIALLAGPSAQAQLTQKLATYDGTQFNADGTTTSSGISFPSTFLTSPNNYGYNGTTFVVPEGLVSFFAVNPSTGYNDGGYRYAWNGDVNKFIQALMFMFQTGNRDDGVSIATAETTMRLRKLAMTCGNTVNVVQDLLSKEGIVSREVHFLTGQTPNNFDDGHVAMEINIGGAWAYYDFDLKNSFTLPGGGLASAENIIDDGVSNLTLNVLGGDSFYEDDWSASKLRYAVYNHQIWETEAQRSAWRARVLQILAIQWNGGTVNGTFYAAGIYAFIPSGLESRTTYVQSLGYNVVSRTVFDAMFYP